MLSALLLAIQISSALPEAVAQWKAEIEARGGQHIETVRIPGDDFPEEDRNVLLSYFKRPDFADAFERAQALTFRYETGGRSRSLILLNTRRIEETRNSTDVLVAHELGHLWLASLGLAPPEFVAGPGACLAIHQGDIVQHLLIREESDRRGIAWREAYARDYEAAYETLRRDMAPSQLGDACYRAQRLSLMVDVRSSFGGGGAYLELLARQDREAEALSIELLEELDGKLSLEPGEYRAALELAKSAIYRLLR